MISWDKTLAGVKKEAILPYVRKDAVVPRSVTTYSNFSSLLLNKKFQQSQVIYSIGLVSFQYRGEF